MKSRLREIRESKGLTATALSRASGVNRVTIWLVETNQMRQGITHKTAAKLAEALGVTVDDLYTDAG